MLVLGVDTSLPLLSAALIRDDAVLAAIALEGKGSRNEKLLPAIDWLLTECNVDRHAIDLYAVTRGPGSFTGVRIGIATVQGIALALGKPVCAMSTHEAIAYGLPPVAIVDDAGRGEYYLSHAGSAPRLAQAHELPSVRVHVADVIRDANVALRCARRAREIAAAGSLERYTDITPIYVRLAEAEVKLQQKTNG